MKALETAYAGCQFRSRLEARWAVALTVDGWHWEYEPEGFETCNHFGAFPYNAPPGHYLPDFRIHHTGGWQQRETRGAQYLEIKPPEVARDLITKWGDEPVASDSGHYEPEAQPILKSLGLICHTGGDNRILVGGDLDALIAVIYFHKGDWIVNHTHFLSDKAITAGRSERFGT